MMFIKYEHSSDPSIFLISDELQRFLGKIRSKDLYPILGEIAFTEENDGTYYEIDKNLLTQYLFK